MIGSKLRWKDKVGQGDAGSFNDYFQRHPEALDEFAHFIQVIHGPLDVPISCALRQWAKDLEIEEDFLEQAIPGLVKDETAAPNEASQRILANCERQWMEFGSKAPVAIARMTLQKNEGKMIVPAADGDDGRVYWDATLDFMNMKPAYRNAACQMDSYESDELREGEAAPRRARNWNGPFAVRADLYPPSSKLAALRQRTWLERQSRPAQGRRPGPRL